MPLPANGTPWPPKRLASIHTAIAAFDAWWVGDSSGLEAHYSTPTARVRPSQMAGGVVGTVARAFWGRPALGAQPRTRLHIPVATDICMASADLLWSEAPDISVDDDAAQARLDTLVDDQALQTFAKGAEAGAAHGGHFLRVTWDATVQPDGPFLTVVYADAADPDFRWGRLVGVTFWSVVREEGQQRWRHLERHELDANGNGVILHGLYEGTADSLGVAVPLAEHSATEALAGLVDEQASITTGSPGLAVVYVPNQDSPRRWRKDPVGVNLGRSDLEGIEGMMDALDEAWSSWMRDIRLGKARLLVSQQSLTGNGLGGGADFDVDQEVYVPLNAPPSSGANATTIAQAEQFKIRHEEHKATVDELLDAILRTAGYSPSTFGRGGDGTMRTAREVTMDQQRSLLTRDRKLRVLRPAVSAILEKLLAVDAFVFNSGVTPVRPSVEFPDGVQESLLELAQTAQALRNAEAASTETLVRMTHPEWDDDDVTDEVGRIMAERDMATPALPDPTDPTLVDGASPDPQS
jgi:A118 family predicted phage portal protein